MATIHIDGKEYEVDGADNLLQACLSLGIDVPYFCWHPALGSVGSCRQCAVKEYKDADDKRGRLVMSCMTPVTDDTYISIEDEEATEFRESVVSWLMSNHPHDCPVCEEGGNCHLQDMTVMTGHSLRDYRFTKRTHENQDLGPFISHEMNRCIACYRCVRYYNDYADGEDFGVYGAHNNVYFGRTESGTLQSEFSGNLVEVCPTGVFTDKTHSSRFNRKWDMQFAPSICQQCSVGCNISPGERYGELRRIENRFNGDVNHYFLCDRGRFGYGYVNLDSRPQRPVHYRGDDRIELNAEQATLAASGVLKHAKQMIGIGSPRASLESNYALQQLVGKENFYSGIEASEQLRLERMLKILNDGGIHTPTLREIEDYDAVVILGEDVTQTAARVALSVRQAVKGKAREMASEQRVADWQIAAVQNIGQHARYPLFITHTDTTRLDDVAAWSYSASASDQARLGFAIAHALDDSAPQVSDLDEELTQKAQFIASALKQSQKPLIISGSQAGNIAVIDAAANIAKALKEQDKAVGLSYVAREVNSMGLAMMGAKPLDDALSAMHGNVDTAIVLENDLYQRLDPKQIEDAISKIDHLLVVDHQQHRLSEQAEFIFSSASFAEADGTVVNMEGRAQRFFQVFDPSYYHPEAVILESWRWLHGIETALRDEHPDWTTLDHVISSLCENIPQLAAIVDAAPNADFRVQGQKLARSPHRYSGRTAMRANISVHEPRQPQDVDSPFSFSMEGNNNPDAQRNEVAFAWAPGWNSPQAWNKFQDEVGGHLRYGDPGVRLFSEEGSLEYFADIPKAFHAKTGQWLIAANYRLFGSDELSAKSEVMIERAGVHYLTLNPVDAEQLGLNEGSVAEFSVNGSSWSLPIQFSSALSCGMVGLPLGCETLPNVLAGETITQLQEGHL
ncbi:NADH-quinone oxidoreductase subunit NuoG [Celerinatantimonas diazotrophica]|uniref:NADH-quinone oxidoreductase n=1 Tax=Celerinatantimonas diazotrophica TaxID=412034 RepID=A0A4R1JLC5_9GAMM|nr:NADH-quinone oxidoreductase subunit NuoG [Celerinatantimonas diazotrophica]TCK51852.1 NADH dehydrogenase subunit G [Celerinatantimonas diazotrophica]CAG9296455.1 NADH-quinone oxidoreductase subunit G [Celerinatantimonas diazotrophica]